MFMEGDPLYDNGDAGKTFRSFNLITQHFEDQEAGLHQYIFNQLPIAILVLRGENYIIESTNDVNLAIWGKGTEVVGKPLLEVMPELSDPGQLQILNDVYKTGVPAYFKELPIFITKESEAETGYYTIEYQPLRNNNGTIAGIVV